MGRARRSRVRIWVSRPTRIRRPSHARDDATATTAPARAEIEAELAEARNRHAGRRSREAVGPRSLPTLRDTVEERIRPPLGRRPRLSPARPGSATRRPQTALLVPPLRSPVHRAGARHPAGLSQHRTLSKKPLVGLRELQRPHAGPTRIPLLQRLPLQSALHPTRASTPQAALPVAGRRRPRRALLPSETWLPQLRHYGRRLPQS